MKILRWFLTGVLLYFVYHETGPATAITLFLVCFMTEIVGEWMRIVNMQIKLLAEADRIKHEALFRP